MQDGLKEIYLLLEQGEADLEKGFVKDAAQVFAELEAALEEIETVEL